MQYPNFANALGHVFTNAPDNGIKNARALAQATGINTSTISRWVNGDILPSAELFEKIAGAFPLPHQEMLLRSYMTDCLPPKYRKMVLPEISAEKIQEDPADDIAAITASLKVFSPEHLSAIRYLLSRAAENPGIRKALISTANAMRGQ